MSTLEAPGGVVLGADDEVCPLFGNDAQTLGLVVQGIEGDGGPGRHPLAGRDAPMAVVAVFFSARSSSWAASNRRCSIAAGLI